MSSKQSIAEVLGLKSDRVEVLRFLGEAAYLWLYLGNLEKAMAVFEGITVVAPNDPVGYLGRCEIYLKQDKFKEAERAATDATKTANASRSAQAMAHVLRGQALASQKRPQEAEKAWQKAAELDPKGAGQQLAEAQRQVAQACGLMPAKT